MVIRRQSRGHPDPMLWPALASQKGQRHVALPKAINEIELGPDTVWELRDADEVGLERIPDAQGTGFDRDGALLAAGVYVLIGGTKAGKTTAIRAALDRLGDDSYPAASISAGEPEAPYTQLASDSFCADIVLALAEAASREASRREMLRPIVFVDSIRPWTNLSGAAGPGGVSRSLYEAIYGFHTLCVRRNVTAILALNPLSEDDLVNLAVQTAVEGSCNGYAFANPSQLSFTTRPRNLKPINI